MLSNDLCLCWARIGDLVGASVWLYLGLGWCLHGAFRGPLLMPWLGFYLGLGWCLNRALIGSIVALVGFIVRLIVGALVGAFVWLIVGALVGCHCVANWGLVCHC
jgi:hypothetical protein